jgi:hypothetical protein
LAYALCVFPVLKLRNNQLVLKVCGARHKPGNQPALGVPVGCKRVKEDQSKKLSQYIDTTRNAVAFRLSERLPVRQEEIVYGVGLSL